MINFLFFISGLFMIYSEIIVWSKFYSQKINYKSLLLYISVFFLTLLAIFNHIYINAFIKVVIVSCFMCLCNWLIFRKSINETIISTIYGQFILVFADGLSAFFVMITFGIDSNLIRGDIFFTSCGNFLTSIVFLFMCTRRFVVNLYLRLLNLFNKIHIKMLFVFCGLIILIINFFVANIYFYLNPALIIIVNSSLIFLFSFIIYRMISIMGKSNLIQAENEHLMESLHQYEDMVDRQRVDNHENKNQLLIIKNMIDKNDKDLVKYINTVIKDKKEDDEVLYTRVKTIPSGGLQGIVYQKMLVMKDEKILFSLDVSRDVRKINLDNLSNDDNYRLCKIIGVLLDNAIEASRDIDDKCIMISLYVDDDMLVVDISNRFSGRIDFDKLDDEGYTSKGDGHGYGLSLVKRILSETDIFENKRSIKKDIFKQVIKVKIKNT